jgi:hypothetical protein
MANDKIEKTTSGALVARPDFIPTGDHRGAEKISKEDLQMPRLALAQALSPELDSTNPRYIDGLKVGDAFNSLTNEVYGKSPIEVVIVRVDKPRFIEFDPTNRGIIKDFNVPANDPRTLFSTDETGKTLKPKATKFMEYIAILTATGEPIALSFKGSGVKVAKKLNGMIQMAVHGGDAPVFAFRFLLTPSIQKDPKSGGTYALFSVNYAGGGWKNSFVTDAELFAHASTTYESIKDVALAIEREPGSDDGDEPLGGPGTDKF